MRLAPALRSTCFAALVTSAASAPGCAESGSRSSRVNPTYIEVDPAEFLGDEVVCGTSRGALRWYVATLIDVTEDQGFRLPSSPPTSCSQSVFFSGVVASGRTLSVEHDAHRYIAEIEGYDSDTLKPRHEGSSVMVSGGETVLPGWAGSCGTRSSALLPLLGVDAGPAPIEDAGFRTQLEGPLEPYPGRTVTFRACQMQRLTESNGTGRITVSLTSALGNLRCGEGEGEVASFEVTLADETKGAACGESVAFGNLPAGAFLEFEVVALGASRADAGSDSGTSAPRWTTTCYQESVADQQLAARCDPLLQDQ
jgi:hypothetical protein